MEIVLTSRKWFCDNSACDRRIFTERIPTVAERYARRTVRLASLFYMLVYAVGGEVGRRIAQAAGLLVSADTLLRAVRRVSTRRGGNGGNRRGRGGRTDGTTDGTTDRSAEDPSARSPITASPAPSSPSVIGIDDFAFRKGHRYGTIIIDHDHRP